MRAKIDENSTVTAGNASGQNDGAAATIVTTRAKAEEMGLKPLVRIVSWGVAGVPPRTMGIGPVPATKLALERAGLGIKDIDLIELNEAFAAQALAVTREWGFGDIGLRAHERPRLRHLAGPPRRRDRRAHPHDARP